MGRSALWLCTWALLGLAAPGCALFGGADKLRLQAPELPLDEWHEDSLHCRRGLCSDWYKVVLQEPIDLEIEADAPVHESLPDFALIVEDSERRRVGDDLEPLHRPRRVQRSFQPGVYYLQIMGLDRNAELMSYKLIARRPPPPRIAPSSAPKRNTPPAARPPAAPPPPRIIESAVIEVERHGGEPAFVLIEAGRAAGMEKGLSGDLVDGAKTLGRVEIVDVYEAGSRARIVGGLSAPITLDTVARIRKPQNGR